LVSIPARGGSFLLSAEGFNVREFSAAHVRSGVKARPRRRARVSPSPAARRNGFSRVLPPRAAARVLFVLSRVGAAGSLSVFPPSHTPGLCRNRAPLHRRRSLVFRPHARWVFAGPVVFVVSLCGGGEVVLGFSFLCLSFCADGCNVRSVALGFAFPVLTHRAAP
jgi:hypothetical protein